MDAHEQSVDEIASKFEDASSEGKCPPIEDYLPQDNDLRWLALWELVETELELRIKAGDPVRVEHYLDRFPELATDVPRLAKVVCAEYRYRKLQEPALDLAEYQQRFADCDAALIALDKYERNAPTIDYLPPRGNVNIRCPYCHTTTSFLPDESLADIRCSSCHGSFSLVRDTEDTDAPDAMVGRFRLAQRVGMGSFASVWKAHDCELDRAVAIKIPRKQLLDPGEAESFFREARAAAQLRHPNIVGVHEVGRDGQSVFIVSDLITGLTLSEWRSRQQLTCREAAQLCATIAVALHHAHEQGVIHRDLKPQNIMIDVQGSPHITDFGLARREVGEVTMTVEGQLMGTPAYMSPEQAQGEAHTADRRSDIYSLGVILFELITGELPFRGSIRMLLHQVLNDEPPSPRRLDSNVPRDLETICLKCIEKDPNGRYQTAEEVGSDLQRFLGNVPIVARPIGTLERARRWCGRHRTVAALTAMIVAIATTAFFAITWQWLTLKKSNSDRTLAQVDALTSAAAEEVPRILKELGSPRGQISRRLQQLVREGSSEKQQTRARLALLPDDPGHTKVLLKSLLQAEPRELLIIRNALIAHGTQVDDQLWNILADKSGSAKEQSRAEAFRAAAFLAVSSERAPSQWAAHASFVTEELLASLIDNPGDFNALVNLLRPKTEELVPPLTGVFRDRSRDEPGRRFATDVLKEYAADDSSTLITLVLDSEPWQFERLMPVITSRYKEEAIERFAASLKYPRQAERPDDEDQIAKRRSNAGVALVQLGMPRLVLPLMSETDDCSARYYFIERFKESGSHPGAIVELLKNETNHRILIAAYLILGYYSQAEFLPGDWPTLTANVLQEYHHHPHPGVHSASRWLLQQWELHEQLASVDRELTAIGHQPMSQQQWYVNSEGHTMLVHVPEVFLMGSPDSEPFRKIGETLHRVKIDRKFAIAMCETTIAQFSRLKTSTPGERGALECPVQYIAWSHAAEYCNLLSQKEAIPEEQWCYVKDATNPNLLMPAVNCLSLNGYRLPTEAEWEYCCRAGTTTARFFGNSPELLQSYAWCPSNSSFGVKRPVGLLKPNDFGLFDIFGNALEWCHDFIGAYPQSDKIHLDNGGPARSPDGYRVLRGSAAGDFEPPRSAQRDAANYRGQGGAAMGFRVARTIN